MNYGGFPDGSVDKEFTCNAGDTGDMGSICGSGRSPGEGHGNLLQHACLENPMDKKSLAGHSPQGWKEWTGLKCLSGERGMNYRIPNFLLALATCVLTAKVCSQLFGTFLSFYFPPLILIFFVF